ncbi:MAG: caspase family protein [Longimicrobiales bacterium]
MTIRWAVAAFGLTLTTPGVAQTINFASELPRAVVLIDETDGLATRGVQAFLRGAGFPLVERRIEPGEQQQRTLRAALAGDEAAAVELGRDYGAHVVIIGRVYWQTPARAAATAHENSVEVELRALRLDAGKLVIAQSGRGWGNGDTDRAARAQAIRLSLAQIMEQSGFVGTVINNWSEQPWSSQDYFRPDPGTADTRPANQTLTRTPLLSLTRMDVLPAPSTVRASERRLSRPMAGYGVRVEGFVAGRVNHVVVEGQNAVVTPLAGSEARRLGLDPGTQRFSTTLQLTPEQSAITVRASAPNGESGSARAAAHIRDRWAVVVGVGNYRSNEISDLHFAARDAQSFHDFLRSPAAGPFADDHILLLKDEQATGAALRDALFVFLRDAGPDDLVVIFFAGHGRTDPAWPDSHYLLPHDADVKVLSATGFPLWDLKTALRRHIKAERVIVLADAFYSSTPAAAGLEGSADANQDGIVTFREVSDYVSGKVRLQTNGRQTPKKSGLGDAPLSEVPEQKR